MKQVWKFQLPVSDFQRIEMPEGSKILWVATQRENPCIWAEVDPKAPKVTRNFAIYGTGHPMQAVNRKYIGSFMLSGGPLVFHLFELT